MKMDEIRTLLDNAQVIAVVGLSDNPSRPSYGVSEYMQRNGYRIIPVNPALTEVLGEKAYPDLRSVPEKIDIVDIFRRPEHVGPIVEEAIEVGARAIWMQLDVVNDEAAKQALDAGLQVVMDRCIAVDHRRLLG